MKIIEAELVNYQKSHNVNSDPYGTAIFEFAIRWANLMETLISQGKSICDIAKQTSRDADTEGITVFMYGAAVSILATYWVHGEELRKWHNLDCQIGTEGEKANDTGGVLNPACLNVLM